MVDVAELEKAGKAKTSRPSPLAFHPCVNKYTNQSSLSRARSPINKQIPNRDGPLEKPKIGWIDPVRQTAIATKSASNNGCDRWKKDGERGVHTYTYTHTCPGL